jgi:hypothetical protein
MISPGQGDPSPAKKVSFPMGRLIATQNAMQSVPLEVIIGALARHGRGDWGIVGAEDWGANQRALENGGRLVSAYYTKDSGRFLIITEADRSQTTVLMPEDY